MKAAALKTLKRTLISIGVLLVIALAGGVGYSWYSDQSSSPSSTVSSMPAVPQRKTISPTQQAADAPMQAVVQSITSPVAPGQPASIVVHTNTNASCQIVIMYNKMPAKASGLTPQTADIYGMITWNWTVDTTAALGTWPETITCHNAKHTAVVQAELQISKATP